MEKIQVYIAGGSKYLDCINWIEGAEQTYRMDQADIALFAGGEDVHPFFYNDDLGRWTSYNYTRDVDEKLIFARARGLNLPMVGICRGAQLVCALSGGRLVQHQENPHAEHPITTWDGEELMITSSHHQAMYPYEMGADQYKIIGWTEGMSKFHLNGRDQEISATPFKEVEIAYFPKTRALGIQGHPEWMEGKNPEHKETLKYLNELVQNLINQTL